MDDRNVASLVPGELDARGTCRVVGGRAMDDRNIASLVPCWLEEWGACSVIVGLDDG